MYIPILQCCAPLVLSLLPFLLYKNRRIVCFPLFCSCKNVFYKVNASLLVVWTLVGGRQELARVCTDLCSLPAFLCSYVLLSFYCCILHSWSLDPWSRPGMTALLAFVVFCGCLLCFLTEEHKNKSFPLILACSCKWICDTFFNQCFAPAVLSLRLSFVVKNRRIVCFFFCLFIVASCIREV